MSTVEIKSVATPTAKPAAKKPAPKSAAKPVAKVAAKPATKPAAKAAPAKPAAKPATEKKAAVVKEEKHKKVKMVRDSFTMPKPEFAVLDTLKSRALQLKAPIKKTELIRAGIKALAAMPDAAFLAAVRAVPSLKTGRPAKNA
jgi:hypothetical protein